MAIDNKKIITLIVPTVLYLGHIFLNFIEFKYLKFYYLLEVLYFTFGILKFKLKDCIPVVLYFLFIEGQGRVIWSYHPFSRIIFDFVLLALVLKAIATQSFRVKSPTIPTSFIVFVGLHFAWYIVHLFNFQSAGVEGVIAAGKIYIFPFLLFFLLANNLEDFEQEDIKNIQTVCIILFFTQSILAFHQFNLREQHLLSISSYYNKTFKNLSGVLFRPYGTSFISGGLSVYLAYSVGLCVLTSYRRKFLLVVPFLAIMFSLAASFIMQVRSAMIKEILIIFLFSITYYFAAKNKVSVTKRYFVNFGIIVSIIFLSNKFLMPGLDLDMLQSSFKRLEQISDLDRVRSQRADWETISGTISDKLTETPFGLGPGRTGSANSIVLSKIKNDPKYGIDYSWTYDNLFVALAIDFGWGMFFYLGSIASLIFYLIRKTFFYTIKRQASKMLILATCTTTVIFAGNWGAIGLPYNPESFFFWLWSALGVIEVNRIRKLNEVQPVESEA